MELYFSSLGALIFIIFFIHIMSLLQPFFNNGFSNLLVVLNLVPILGSLAILSIPAWKVNSIRSTALTASLITFLLSLVLWTLFDPSTADFQFRYELSTHNVGGLFNFSFGFGVDGINIWLILLTTFLTPICILVGWLIPGTVEIKGV
jgi:NADH:ubiquinone oxidoreductase subunit 4 (subunit M)